MQAWLPAAVTQRSPSRKQHSAAFGSGLLWPEPLNRQTQNDQCSVLLLHLPAQTKTGNLFWAILVKMGEIYTCLSSTLALRVTLKKQRQQGKYCMWAAAPLTGNARFCNYTVYENLQLTALTKHSSHNQKYHDLWKSKDLFAWQEVFGSGHWSESTMPSPQQSIIIK